MNIFIFKTDITEMKQVRKVAPVLRAMKDILKWNFDLHDSDNILRIETLALVPQQVEHSLQQAGHYCKELE
ncbi:hypothetical protein [Parasediminibacterium sp. JCM 36343]|uniref:hypothetical protein n=1 Tax=Parasediminibacterium sp. JCM 36343 TaxID=3374279 RepID=UPI003977E569